MGEEVGGRRLNLFGLLVVTRVQTRVRSACAYIIQCAVGVREVKKDEKTKLDVINNIFCRRNRGVQCGRGVASGIN